MKFILIILFLIVSLFSCDFNEKTKSEFFYSELQTTYNYTDDLKKYLKDVFQKDLTKMGEGILIFVPLNSCLPCVSITLNELLKLKSDDKIKNIILSGVSDDSLINETIDKLTIKYKEKVLYDIDSRLFRYEINIGGPSIIIIDPKRILQIVLDAEIWENKDRFLPFLQF